MADELKRNRRPSTPGDILRGLYLEPRGISVREFAGLVEISTKHASQVLNGHVRVSPELAARLGKVFGNGAGLWLRLQAAVDAWDAERAFEAWTPARVIGATEAA